MITKAAAPSMKLARICKKLKETIQEDVKAAILKNKTQIVFAPLLRLIDTHPPAYLGKHHT